MPTKASTGLGTKARDRNSGQIFLGRTQLALLPAQVSTDKEPARIRHQNQDLNTSIPLWDVGVLTVRLTANSTAVLFDWMCQRFFLYNQLALLNVPSDYLFFQVFGMSFGCVVLIFLLLPPPRPSKVVLNYDFLHCFAQLLSYKIYLFIRENKHSCIY